MVTPSTAPSVSSSSSSVLGKRTGLLCSSPLRPKKDLRNINNNDVHDYNNEIEATTQETISTSTRTVRQRRRHKRFRSGFTSKDLIFKAACNRYRASINERIRRLLGVAGVPFKKHSFGGAREVEEPPMVLPKPLSPPISSTTSSSSSSKTNIINFSREFNRTAAQSRSVLVEDNPKKIDYSFEELRAAFYIQHSLQELRV